MTRSTHATNLLGMELLFLTYILNFGIAIKSTPAANVTEKKMDKHPSNIHVDFKRISAQEMTERQLLKEKWITDIFSEAKKVFDVDSTANAHCRRDYNTYKLHLRNQTVWAIRMFESSEWPSVGLLSGKTYHLGDWDECVKANGPFIRGQYCLADLSINLTSGSKFINDTSRWDQWPREDSSAWDIIETYSSAPFRLDRHKIKWATCIPSSCLPTDLETSLNNTLTPLFQKYKLSTLINVNPLLCSTRKTTYSIGYYFTYAFFGVLIATVVTSTIYDFFNYKVQGELSCWLPMKLFKCFSVRQNYMNLIRYSSAETTNPGIYLIKVIYMIFIINGHRLYNVLAYPTFPIEVVEMNHQPTNATLVSLTIIDVFFMLSGFLTFQLGFKPMKKGGYIFLCVSILFRWIRMMPSVGLLLLFVAHILPHISEGPLWNYRVSPTAETCKITWWTDLMAVSNIVEAKKQCLPVIWYVCVDIQLSILGGILLFIITKWKRIGAILVLIIFLLATEILGILVYRRKYHGSLLLYLKTFKDYRESEEFYRLYISTVSRIGPYLVGLGAAFSTKVLKERKYTFSGKQTILILLGTFVIGQGTQYYSLILYDHTRPYKPLENAVYATLKRPLFVLPLASLLCIYFTSGLGKFNKLFEWKIWVSYGRLVYSVFLVHYVIQMYHASSQRQYTFIPATLNEYWLLCSDTINSFLVGLLMYLISEGPANSISKLLQSYLIRSHSSSLDGSNLRLHVFNAISGSHSFKLKHNEQPNIRINCQWRNG